MLRREGIGASEHSRRNGAGRRRGALVLVGNEEAIIPHMAIYSNQPLAPPHLHTNCVLLQSSSIYVILNNALCNTIHIYHWFKMNR